MLDRPDVGKEPARMLKLLRERLLQFDPGLLPDSEPAAVARELNEWRRVLARIAVVKSNPKIEGWGDVLTPSPRPPRTAA